uniref:Uncharacterized protein n=1 Tax=Arundo donax TaxID=35708 RepID=A0A0A8ZCB1_ARUDO
MGWKFYKFLLQTGIQSLCQQKHELCFLFFFFFCFLSFLSLLVKLLVLH